MDQFFGQFHPLVVHFPIALLLVYAAAEVIRLPIFRRISWWKDLKGTLVILGSIGALAAVETGDSASHALSKNASPWLKSALERHEQFAEITLILFSILALGYLLRWISKSNYFSEYKNKPAHQKTLYCVEKTCGMLLAPSVSFLLALIGLASITITGALGGLIAHGPIDPIAKLMAKLLLPPL